MIPAFLGNAIGAAFLAFPLMFVVATLQTLFLSRSRRLTFPTTFTDTFIY